MKDRSIDVILVDDDPEITLIAKEMLAELNLTILECHDSLIAPELILAHKPKIVFLDLHMPGLSGDKIIVELSRHHIFKTTSFILITGSSYNSHEKIVYYTLGFEEVLSKPFSIEDLVSAVKRIIP